MEEKNTDLMYEMTRLCGDEQHEHDLSRGNLEASVCGTVVVRTEASTVGGSR